MNTKKKFCFSLLFVFFIACCLVTVTFCQIASEIVPISVFEDTLSDTCKLLDLKITRKCSANVEKFKVPVTIRAINYITTIMHREKVQGRADTRRYCGYQYLLKGNDSELKCMIFVIDQQVYKIVIITSGYEPNLSKARILGITLGKWRVIYGTDLSVETNDTVPMNPGIGDA